MPGGYVKSLYREVRIDSWADLTRYFRALRGSWIFRGQREATWDISSTIERLGHDFGRLLLIELGMRKLFARKVHLYAGAEAACDSFLGLLALMQHHGVPTRLLDWTTSPYVAAFFALEDAQTSGGERAVWAVDHSWLNEQSRRLICKKFELADHQLPEHSDFSPDHILRPYVFDVDQPLAVSLTPTRVNIRLSVQQGVFLCPGDLSRSFMENLAALGEEDLPARLIKIIIPDRLRVEGLYELNVMNIGPESLFPGLDGFARDLRLRCSLVGGDFVSEETRQLRRELGIKDT